jgi:PTS system ascorbate-specific IIA component
MYPQRETLSSAEFRHAIVAQGVPGVSSLWHQQQKNPPFVLLHDLYKN